MKFGRADGVGTSGFTGSVLGMEPGKLYRQRHPPTFNKHQRGNDDNSRNSNEKAGYGKTTP
jgi:hypothetical protein